MHASFNTFANSHQNAIEAIQARGGADGRVELDFKEIEGVNKLRITDNGIAMTPDEVRAKHKPALGINRHTGFRQKLWYWCENYSISGTDADQCPTVGADHDTDTGLLVPVSPYLFDPLLKRFGCGVLVAHTGQSSQLFPVTIGRNAQFVATVAGSGLIRGALYVLILEHTRLIPPLPRRA